MSDAEFMTQITTSICDYAVANNMSPNETIKATAENLLVMLEVASFDQWKGGAYDEYILK